MAPAIRDAGQRLAEEDHRTLSNFLESLILKDIKAKGGKPPKAPDRRGRGKEGGP